MGVRCCSSMNCSSNSKWNTDLSFFAISYIKIMVYYVNIRVLGYMYRGFGVALYDLPLFTMYLSALKSWWPGSCHEKLNWLKRMSIWFRDPIIIAGWVIFLMKKLPFNVMGLLCSPFDVMGLLCSTGFSMGRCHGRHCVSNILIYVVYEVIMACILILVMKWWQKIGFITGFWVSSLCYDEFVLGMQDCSV